MRLILAVLTALATLNCVVLSPCKVERKTLYWYEYVQDEIDEGRLSVKLLKSESDPSLIVGDYVLTDGMTYQVVNSTWVERKICHGVVVKEQ